MKKEDGTEIDEWSCPKCTYINTANKCEMCGCSYDAQ